MLIIDGSFGEGGGQILRTSLSLALCLTQSFHITHIRANRKKPGLMRQHLVAVEAAKTICNAEVEGAYLGSQELTFIPHAVRSGEYFFNIGTAGSTTLVLQTILPCLLTAPGKSALILEGGTHNPLAPPFEFLDQTFLPVINQMGSVVDAHLEQVGFFPVGGGRVRINIRPTSKLNAIDLIERGDLLDKHACAILSALPLHIAERELEVIRRRLGWRDDSLHTHIVETPKGPGNALVIIIKCEYITEVFAGFGQRGVRAETVADNLINEVLRYLNSDVPVGEYLADQLLLPFALAGGGSYITFSPSRHVLTNIAVLQKFLDINISQEMIAKDTCKIKLG